MEEIDQTKDSHSARCMIVSNNLFETKDNDEISEIKGINGNYVGKSCNCFGSESCLRKVCIYLLESRFWEPFWLMLITGNLVVLALYDYHDREDEDEFNFVLTKLNTIFTAFYGLEALIKMVALGLWDHEKAYFRSGWHWIDVIIVITGVVNSIPMLSCVKGMKVFFALRVLKFEYSWNLLRRFLIPLALSLSQLTGVLLFLLFLIIFFSFIGLNSFQADFYYRCRTTSTPSGGTWDIDHSLTRLCSVNWQGAYSCPSDRYCGHPKMYDLSPEDESLRDFSETYYGGVNFDNALRAFLATFQVISFDSWADIMYKIQDSTNQIFSVVFFPVLVFIGSFFGLNLIVAVIVNNFQENRGGSDPQQDDSNNQNISRKGTEQLQQVVPYDSTQDIGVEKDKSLGVQDGSTLETSAGCMNFFKIVTESLVFRCIIILSVIANLVIISFVRYGISEYEKGWVNKLDAICVGIFILEMILKLFAQGICTYFSNSYNVLDFILVILGITEVILAFMTTYYHALVIIAIFRGSRGLKLIEQWTALRDIVRFIGKSMGDIFNFAICLAIFLFMYAIIGMELFGNEIKLNDNDEIDFENGVSPRLHFDNFGNALKTTFSLVIGDNWTTSYYIYNRFDSLSSILYFFTGILVLNVILVNLFVAIIMQSFFEDEQQKKLAEEEQKNVEFAKKKKEKKKEKKEIRSQMEKFKHKERTLLSFLKIFSTLLSLNRAIKEKLGKNEESELFGTSLNLFSNTNSFRLVLFRIVKSIAFELLIFVIIFSSSIVLTFQTNIYDPNGDLLYYCDVFDIFLTAFFSLEIIIKFIAFGIITNGPDSYFLNPWYVMDFVLTVTWMLSVWMSSYVSSLMSLFLACRVLRVVRIVTVYDGFFLSMKAIISGAYKIFQALIIAFLFVLIFGAVGIEVYGGLLNYCDSSNISNPSITTIYDCMNSGGEWRDRDIGFDNIGAACLTLFELSTGKSLTALFQYLPDIVDYDMEPVRDSNQGYTAYIIVFAIFGFFFIKAILTGIISDTFFKERDLLQGFQSLSLIQVRWAKLAGLVFKAAPTPKFPEDSSVYCLHRFFENSCFKLIMQIILIIYGVVLALPMYPSDYFFNIEPKDYMPAFFAIYSLEAFFMIICYGRDYFTHGWDIFDFTISCASIIVLCLDQTNWFDMSEGIGRSIMYSIFASKLLLLFRYCETLRKTFKTLVLALPSIINLALLFLIMMFLLSVSGVQLFATTKFQTYYEDHANFSNILVAFLTVFRMSTLDGWNDIMHDASRSKKQYFDCVRNPSYEEIQANGGVYNGCGESWAIAYFLLLIVIVVFIFLNLFLAIVVGSVSEIEGLSESVLSDDKIEKFQNEWKKYDPKATGYIEYSSLRDFLAGIGKPLGSTENKMNNRYYSAVTLWMLELKVYQNKEDGLHYIEFYDVLEALVKKTLYDPETLDNIFNNASPAILRESLANLSWQKGQLLPETQPVLRHVEVLSVYYKRKNSRIKNQQYTKRKIKLPVLVWATLKVTRFLRKSVKARKKAQ